MKAYRLPDGRVLIPQPVYEDGFLGDGMMLVQAGSPEAKEWAPWTVPAHRTLVEEWKDK